MKNHKLLFILLVAILITVSGCVSSTTDQPNSPTPNSKGATPTSNGQVTIPAVSFQINVPGPNPLQNKADSHNQISGILLGIWHGVISPITLVLSFINPNTQMYEVHNDGSPYNFGFLFGIALFFLILSSAFRSGRR
jgi:hypothetical protein